MKTQFDYDAVIIGAGQAGGPLSTTLARAGWRVALVESRHVGGSCINEGCTPTKTMVASARVAHLVRRAADYGVQIGGEVQVDFSVVRERKRKIVASFRSGSQRSIERTEGVDLIMGEGSFVDAHTVQVQQEDGGTRRFTAEHIFINTGTRPAVPEIDGIDSVPFLTNRTIMELDTVPQHLLILGGGYIGIEFGQMFRRFGSEVTIVQRGTQVLSREDEDVAEEVQNILAGEGIRIFLQSKATAVKQENGRIRLEVQTPEGTQTLEGSHLLVAAGRTPNSDMLNLEAAGLETDARGFIPVDEKLRTHVPHIYALGDIKGGPAFTHISYDDFRIIRTNLLEGGHATTRGRLVPYTVFMDPELGRVGMNEKEARQAGIEYRVAKLPMTHVARALESDETRGFMKALVDAESGRILGAAVLSIFGGEVMTVLQMAMMGGVPYTAIKDGVFAHPTLSESLNNLFMAMDRRG